jgi:hypothetical protein
MTLSNFAAAAAHFDVGDSGGSFTYMLFGEKIL